MFSHLRSQIIRNMSFYVGFNQKPLKNPSDFPVKPQVDTQCSTISRHWSALSRKMELCTGSLILW